MANSPTQMTVTVNGELILRLKDGSEYVMGDIDLEMPVTINYVGSEAVR